MTVTGEALVAGVMGWPVAHSRSPRLHGFWLRAYGVDGAYVPLAVPPDGFERALRALPALGFRGCNVTLPHKERALALADAADAAARRIGAANTVVVGADGALEVSNTDAFGFMENLRQRAPGWPAARPAAVLGAGGAGRAVVVALLDAGAPEVRLANRTAGRARDLAGEFGRAGPAGRLERARGRPRRRGAGRQRHPARHGPASRRSTCRWIRFPATPRSATWSTPRWRPACCAARPRGASTRSMAWACSCTRPGPASPPGSGASRKSPPPSAPMSPRAS